MNTHNAAPTLTVAALARDEAAHLRACFESLAPLTGLPFVDTLVVLDRRADDATKQAAEEVADHVITSEFVNFSAQRNRALDNTSGEWLFFIDPDERMTPALAKEIEQSIGEDEAAAYRVPRRNIIFGYEVRHTGWSPDYQIRLMRRESCRYDEAQAVHEVPIVHGETGTLHEPLIHFNYESWGQFLSKQRSYAKHEAGALYTSGLRATPKSMLGQPLREFKRRFFDYRGYMDGTLGLSLSFAMMLYKAEAYRQLWLLQRHEGR